MWAASGTFVSKSQTGRGERFDGLRSLWIKQKKTKKRAWQRRNEVHRATKRLRNITECAAASETAPEDNTCYIETSEIVFVGRRRLPALNFPHSLSSPSFLVLLLLVHLFLQILCWQRAAPEALLRLYNHRNHLHLHRSGFNSKCGLVSFGSLFFSGGPLAASV